MGHFGAPSAFGYIDDNIPPEKNAKFVAVLENSVLDSTRYIVINWCSV